MTPSLNIGNLIKRLNLIKGLILLEEFDDLVPHLKKIREGLDDAHIKEIVKDIDSKYYSDAVAKIEIFLAKNQSLLLFEDPEIEALKIEIKKLEIEISSASDEIVDTEKLIHDFDIRHTNELGDIINRILSIRLERLEREKDENNEKKKEFEDAQKDYSEYKKQYEETKSEKFFELSEQEKIELKTKYRKASKLCHPDVVTDELRPYAEAMFKELKTAYDQNDLKKVTEILNALEKGEVFIAKSAGINEKVKLRAEVIALRGKLNDLKNKLQSIRESEVYQTIVAIPNWNEYFERQKIRLMNQLSKLENGRD